MDDRDYDLDRLSAEQWEIMALTYCAEGGLLWGNLEQPLLPSAATKWQLESVSEQPANGASEPLAGMRAYAVGERDKTDDPTTRESGDLVLGEASVGVGVEDNGL